MVCAQDQGVTVSPDGSRQQMEGSITMGLGYALTEEVRFKDGEVLDRNFDTYQIPRFSWLPKIETVLIDNPDDAGLGLRRAAHRHHGRGGRQRDLRRRGRPAAAAADDPGARAGGAQAGVRLVRPRQTGAHYDFNNSQAERQRWDTEFVPTVL